MRSDAEIEHERALLAEQIGPTRAEWYAEACRLEGMTLVQLWGCRYREMAREAALLTTTIKKLISYCQYAAGSFAQVPSDKAVPPIVLHDCKDKLDEAIAVARRAILASD